MSGKGIEHEDEDLQRRSEAGPSYILILIWFYFILYNFIFAFSLKGWDIGVEMVSTLAGLIYGGSSGLKFPMIYFT